MTTAAILETIVKANTTAAVRDLRQYDSYLKRVDKSSVSTTARTSTLGKATSSLGSRMRSAAGYAAGAAAAYVSIAQAKAAVTTTQDLAKTTAGLNRNLGLSVKTASQWGAVAKSRDVDAKSLTMSFTTLSRRLTDTNTALKEGGGAAKTAMAPFARLGLSQQDVAKGSQDLASFLPKLADAFGKAEGGAERQASAQQLLGRGYQSLLPLFADGAKGLEEQQKWADKYGATLNQKTLKAQMKLVSAQRETKVAWLGLQVAFAKFVTPALEKVNKQFQQIAAIMADDKLTSEEKWKRIAGIIEKWADRALDAFLKILPVLVERAGEAAPKIAAAFVKGFLNAPILGQLLLGGWLLSKMGGIGTVGKLGTKLGTTIGRFAGPAAAVAIGAALGAEFAKTDFAQKHIAHMSGFGEKIAEELDIGLKKAMQVEKFLRTHPGLSAPDAFQMMKDAARNARQAVVDDIDLLASRWGASLKEIKQRTSDNMKAIRSTMGTESMKARLAIANNFQAAKDAIKASMDAGEISARQGAKAIHQVLIKQLKSYGISDPEGFLKTTEGKASRDTSGTPSPGGKQKGGMVPGYGHGDKVPLHIGGKMAAMVEPGEYVSVANKRATAALMMANDAVPRFAKGGTIPGATAGLHSGIMGLLNDLYANYGGSVSSGIRAGGSSLHATANAADYVPGDWKGASAAANSAGPNLLEGIYNPGVHGGSAVSWDTGNKVSPSFWGAATWGDHLDHIHLAVAEGVEAAVGKGAIAAAEKVNLPRFEGLTGLGGLVATGLNKVAAGAEQEVNKKLAAQVGGSLGGTVATGPVQQMAQEMVTKMWGPGQWPPFVSLEMAEAGWDPKAVNPSSGAAGLAQALPPSKYPPGAWPYQGPESAKLQLQWMTGYIRDRYGDPASAWAFHQSHNWYKEGGVVLSGDSLGQGMRDSAGFPSGWNLDVVKSRNSADGAAKVPGLLDKYDPDALVFEHGSNDSGGSMIKGALGKIKQALGSTGLALMNTSNNPGANRVIEGFGRMDELADWAAIADKYVGGDGVHTDAAGYRAMQKIVKAAANKAKKKGKDRKPGEEDEDGGRGAVGAGDGTQSYSPADIPKKILDMVDAHQGAIKLLDNEIMLAGHFASYNSSEAGASEGPLEIAKQLFLNQQLLTNLEGLKGWLKRGMRLKRTSAKGKKHLQDLLTPLVGDESSVGRILDTKKRIDDLMHPDLAGAEISEGDQFKLEYWKEEARKANQRFGVSQAQYAVFRDFAGGFAGGGYIPQGKWGVVGESGPEVVGGPSTVAQMGGDGVTVVVNGDIINTPPGMQPVEVQGAKTIVQQGSRGYGRRPLGSARGY